MIRQVKMFRNVAIRITVVFVVKADFVPYSLKYIVDPRFCNEL